MGYDKLEYGLLYDCTKAQFLVQLYCAYDYDYNQLYYDI